MRRKTMIAMAVVGGLAAIAAADQAGMTLFDAPRGRWLAEMRPDAPVTVLEERDGWRLVRIEGWVPVRDAGAAGAASAAPPAPLAAPPAAPAPPSAVAPPAEVAPVAAPASPGATIRGVLLPRQGMTPATVGAGLVVALVGDLAGFAREHAALTASCRAEVEEQEARATEAQDRVGKALNSTTNFTEASRRYDRAKADLASARKARARAADACVEQIDALVDRHTVARAPSDSAGRFEFTGIAPGEYRAIARDRGEGTGRTWVWDARPAGGGSVVLDPAAAEAPDPYAGLR